MDTWKLTLSLRTRLLFLVLIASLPLFGLIAYSAWNGRAMAAAEAQRQTRQLAQLITGEQNRLIEQAKQMMILLSNVPVVRDPALVGRCDETFSRIRQQNPMYGNLGLVDARGRMLCSALPFKPGFNIADRSWFQRAMDTKSFAYGDYLIGRLSGLPSLTLSYPLLDESGRVEKVLFAAVSLAWMHDFLGKISLPEGSAILIVDANGVVLVRYPDLQNTWVGKTVPQDGMLKALLAKDCSGYQELVGLDGVERLNALEPLQMMTNGCVYVRVGIPKSEIYAPINRRLRQELIAMVGVVLLMFAVAWFGSDLLVLQRVRVLANTARSIGQGDLDARTGLRHSGEELGQLARSFDEMADGLQQREFQLAVADRALSRANRALTVLSAGNHIMLRAADEKTLLDDMCRMIVDKATYPMAWVGYVDDNDRCFIRSVAHAGIHRDYAEKLELQWTPANSEAGGIAAKALDERRPAVVRVDAKDSLSLAWSERIRGRGLAACIALPLRSEEAPLGVLCIYAEEKDAFDDEEITLLDEAASDLSFGIAKLRDQARRREAENANRIKSEFLANMSHELRTPLNAIIGFSEVMKDGLVGELSAEQNEYITDIFVSGRHLLALINDILDLSKVEAGKMALDLEGVQLPELLENSLSVIREKAAVHRIQLRQDVQQNLPPVMIDVRKVKQIVYNLLSNAVKFTPDGGTVTLRARHVSRSEVENWASGRPNAMRLPLPAGDHAEYLEIAVEDTGIGIKPEDAPRLFQPFSQLDSSLSRHFEGTGLGLAMIMKMTELHGGTVAVGSQLGKGSCFTVWLPWRTAMEVQSSPTALPPSRRPGHEALVVEDNDTAADLVRLQLEAAGLTMIRVRSAEEALEILARKNPCVIVLDVLLPGMDGWALLGRIKQPQSPWTDIPVVIVSVVADLQKGFSLGAAQVLQKPVGREELVSAMGRLGFHGPGRRGKVLVVDDDPKAVTLLSAYLAEAGFTVQCAYGGRLGLEMTQREHPDLLVLDLLMPDMTGFDLIATLRSQDATRELPIVVVTAKELSTEERESLHGQVSAVLEKTRFDHGQFAAEIQRIADRC